MADTIKIGSLDISAFKVGSDDCKVYLGDTLLYPQTPPTPSYKWLATYSYSHTESAACDASSAITHNEIEQTNLVSVEIGDCVTDIGYSAFENCFNLTSCTIGSGVTSIGEYAFYQCNSLTSIDIPDSVTSIGDRAFDYCNAMTTCTIGSGVTSIGDGAFYGCSNLISITVNATTPPTLGMMPFDNTNNYPIYVPCESVNAYKAASGWSNYTSRITCIQPTFQGKWLATYSDSHTESAQCDATSAITQNEIILNGLVSVEIGDCVTSIGDTAFIGCSSLTNIGIPSGVTSIGDGAFYGCSNLISITVNALVPPALGYVAFDNTNNCPIFVPSGSVNAYKSAIGWSYYASRILAMPTQIHYGDSLSNLSASIMRVSTAITLSESHNVTFGDISSNTYSLLYENGNWYNWRVITNGAFTPDSKTLLTASDGYYTIAFDSTYPCLGADADVYGQGGTMFAPFDFEIS